MRLVVLRAGLALAAAVCARAENWPQWRGPFFNGSSTEAGLPGQWSKTDNIAWAAALPGFSGATPAIWEDSVFVSSPDPQRDLLLICLERKTGKLRWQKAVAAGDREKGRNNMASPSPVTDGQSVFVLFGTGDLAAFDFSGKELWRRQLAKEYGPFAINWLYGSSPMLYGGRLYVEVIQGTPRDGASQGGGDAAARGPYLLCLDPATGGTSGATSAPATPSPSPRGLHHADSVRGARRRGNPGCRRQLCDRPLPGHRPGNLALRGPQRAG